MSKKHKKGALLILLFCIILIIEVVAFPIKAEAATYNQVVKSGIENFPEDYKEKLNKLKELYPNWNFTAYYTGISWNEFITEERKVHLRNTVHKSSSDLWKDDCGKIASGYMCASEAILKYFADPRNFISESGIFQFLEMTYNENAQTEEGVKSIIAPTFMNKDVTFNLNGQEKTMHYSKIIMEAAKESKMSPYSIAIKIIQEVGVKGSSSVSGTYVTDEGVDYSGYYNFFNYGAYDTGNAIANGLKYAMDNGWNNQYTAIVEGAKKMANSYTNAGQNTAYFYKWDVVGNERKDLFSHQYMTNIQDPSSQAKSLFNTYAKNNLLPTTLNFIIPVYEGMPNVNNLPGTIDPSLSSSYYLTGTDVRLRENATTSSSILATLEKNQVVKLLEWNTGTANGYEWAKIELGNGTIGYVANKYLAQCNPTPMPEPLPEPTPEPTPDNGDDNQEKLAKIENEYIIANPNKTIEEIMKSLKISNYSVKDIYNSTMEKNEIITTGFKVTTDEKEYTVAVLGDVYADGKIDARDYMKIKNHIMGTSNLEGAEKVAGNVYIDSEIDARDYMKVKNHIMGTGSITI